MVKVVKSQPADHSTKGTESAVLTTDHVVSSDQFKNSSAEKYMRADESQTWRTSYDSMENHGEDGELEYHQTH